MPDNIANAWILVSEHFGYDPVLTYASSVQFNWYSTKKDIASITLEDLIVSSYITGTQTEIWFYQISLAIELESVRIIPIMQKLNTILINQDLFFDIKSDIISLLESLLNSLKTIELLLAKLPEKCDPNIFFNHFRCYLSGWDTPDFKEVGGLKFGSAPNAPIFSSTGGSAAQSPIMQAVDALFNIRHPHNPDGSPNYLYTIRKYMPISDRDYIRWVETWGSDFRNLCLKSGIIQPFVNCISQIIANRQEHAGIVWKYVMVEAMKLSKDAKAVGTGGTVYDKFLSSIIASSRASLEDFQEQSLKLQSS